MRFIEKIKAYLEGKEKKKLIENAVIGIIIGVILVVAGGSFFKRSETNSGKSALSSPVAGAPSGVSVPASAAPAASDLTATQLKTLLSTIKGVGKVDVMITYSAGKETVPAYDKKSNSNMTAEKDSDGGTREISQQEEDASVVYEDSAEGKKPVILKELEPVIKGVAVSAEGAGSAEVREEIIQTVNILLDVPVHKIQVVQRIK